MEDGSFASQSLFDQLPSETGLKAAHKKAVALSKYEDFSGFAGFVEMSTELWQ